jgi:hypothetical protein
MRVLANYALKLTSAAGVPSHHLATRGGARSLTLLR